MYYSYIIYVLYVCIILPRRKDLNKLKKCRLFSTLFKINRCEILEKLKVRTNKKIYYRFCSYYGSPGGTNSKKYIGINPNLGKIIPRLKPVRITLETSNLASKYTPICSFRKYTF